MADLTILENAALDGRQMITISASAAGYALATATILVNDNETAMLGLSLPPSAREGSACVKVLIRA